MWIRCLATSSHFADAENSPGRAVKVSLLSSSIRQRDVSSLHIFLDCILCTPSPRFHSPPPPFLFFLQTPPSASTHLTLRNPIRRTSDWMYGRTVTTKHKLQSHSPPPLSFSCSLSHLLFPSLPLSCSLCIVSIPHCLLLLSFRLLFLLLLTPSAVSFSSLSSFLVATVLAASPYIPPFLPTLPPSSCSFLRASKLPSAHSHIALHHSSPVWENHVSYSGPGPDCMRWK